ncbi:MAG: DUF4347 domain-containing protein, partial [Trichodesmium sp. St2_bin2_1]|nr:DUF4347 domain-containing protein [Trichodesmium sp. St2_bin2_1]
GRPGCLYLGNGQLNVDNINDDYISDLQGWSVSNLLLYGCNVAAGDGGAEFLEKLHRLTGVNVAASAGLTGSFTLGGDWELEVIRGELEVDVPFTQETQQQWDYVLAKDDYESIDADLILTGENVLSDNGNGADSDPDTSDSLTVTEVNGVAANVGSQITLTSGALLTLNNDGTYSYDPNSQFESLGAGETTTDSFSYTISDGNGGTDTATVTITINGQNNPPVVNSSSITVDEESIDTSLGLTAPTDADGDTLTITVTGLPTLGTVTKADGTAVNNGETISSADLVGLQYDAPAEYNAGDDPGDFTYSVSDGIETVNGSTDITINPVNDSPVVDNSNITVDEESTDTSLGLTAPT